MMESTSSKWIDSMFFVSPSASLYICIRISFWIGAGSVWSDFRSNVCDEILFPLIQALASFSRRAWISLKFLLFLRTVFGRLGFSSFSFGMTSCLRKFLGMSRSSFVASILYKMCLSWRYSTISCFEMFRSGRRTFLVFWYRDVSWIPVIPCRFDPLMKFRRIVSRLSSRWWAVRM